MDILDRVVNSFVPIKPCCVSQRYYRGPRETLHTRLFLGRGEGGSKETQGYGLKEEKQQERKQKKRPESFRLRRETCARSLRKLSAFLYFLIGERTDIRFSGIDIDGKRERIDLFALAFKVIVPGLWCSGERETAFFGAQEDGRNAFGWEDAEGVLSGELDVGFLGDAQGSSAMETGSSCEVCKDVLYPRLKERSDREIGPVAINGRGQEEDATLSDFSFEEGGRAVAKAPKDLTAFLGAACFNEHEFGGAGGLKQDAIAVHSLKYRVVNLNFAKEARKRHACSIGALCCKSDTPQLARQKVSEGDVKGFGADLVSHREKKSTTTSDIGGELLLPSGRELFDVGEGDDIELVGGREVSGGLFDLNAKGKLIIAQGVGEVKDLVEVGDRARIAVDEQYGGPLARAQGEVVAIVGIKSVRSDLCVSSVVSSLRELDDKAFLGGSPRG